MLISDSTRIVATKHQVSCDLAGETAILNLKNSVYYGLNPVGARIWGLVQSPTTIGAVRETIAREYDVEADRCDRDVAALVDRLAAEDLVVLS